MSEIQVIRNIIFDMGNVLLDFNPEVCARGFFTDEEDVQLIIKELFNGLEWIEGDYGRITNIERYDGVSNRVPKRLHNQLLECVLHWYDYMGELPHAKEFVLEMKKRGYKVFILSNACNEFYSYFPKFLPLEFFDGIVVSSDIHVVKPDKRAYEYLLDKYNLVASECIFVDDRLDNVEGAKAVGLNGVLFQGDFSIVENLL